MSVPQEAIHGRRAMRDLLVRGVLIGRLSLLVAAGLPYGLVPGFAFAAESESEQDQRTAIRYIAQHDYPQALVYMQKALERDPKSVKANSGMGNLYAGMHQYEKAIPYLEKALSLDPNDPTVLFGLGACYMDLQQHERAIPYLEKIVKLKPNEQKPSEVLAVAYVRRGATYGRQGKNRQAKASIQSAIALFRKIGKTARVDELTAMLKDIPTEEKSGETQGPPP